MLDLANIPQEKRTNGLLNKLTVAILAGVTGMALVVKDLSFLLSLGGATLGNSWPSFTCIPRSCFAPW